MPTPIESKLYTKSMGQLEKEIKQVLANNYPDRPIEEVFAAPSGDATWGRKLPHKIAGHDYEKLEYMNLNNYNRFAKGTNENTFQHE